MSHLVMQPSAPWRLPISPPYFPMEAELVRELPEGESWQYEPKWDGFRCLVFRNRDDVLLQSKSGQQLERYFPDLVSEVLSVPCERFVFDSEIVIPVEGKFSFDELLMRIHPAASRVRMLAKEFPATLLVFDLLVDESGAAISGKPLRERRSILERLAAECFDRNRRVVLSPATEDVETARRWLHLSGGDMDGVIAKRLDFEYRSGERSAMRKVKLARTAECVIGGFRYSSAARSVGSLLLGLYNEEGLLDHVGFTSGLSGRERRDLLGTLTPLIQAPGFTGRAPGGPSRWSSERSAQWEPLRPELVVEVQYDHFSGGRFRHGTRLLRWRPDKSPRQCTSDQVRRESSALPFKFR